jgi:hypothetical protein
MMAYSFVIFPAGKTKISGRSNEAAAPGKSSGFIRRSCVASQTAMSFQETFRKNYHSFNTVENQEPVEGPFQTPGAETGQVGKCHETWTAYLWVLKKRIQCFGDNTGKLFGQFKSGKRIQSRLQEIPAKLPFQINVKPL